MLGRYLKKRIITGMTTIIMICIMFFSLTAFAQENQDKVVDPEAQHVIDVAMNYIQEKDYDSAKIVLQDYIANEPDTFSEQVYGLLGYCLISEGNMEEAIKLFEKAYKKDPENEIVISYYAYVLFRADKFAQVAPMLEKLYNTHSEKHVGLLSLAASAYFQSDNLDEAKRVYKRMVDLPGNPYPSLINKLIQICYLQGCQDEAKKYERLLEEIKANVFAMPNTANKPQGQNNAEFNAKVSQLNQVDAPPRILHTIMPSYPFYAKFLNIEGWVTLRFVIGTDGYANEPDVYDADPVGFFEEAALDAIGEFRFKPAMKDGKPVNCIVRQTIVFELSE